MKPTVNIAGMVRGNPAKRPTAVSVALKAALVKAER